MESQARTNMLVMFCRDRRQMAVSLGYEAEEPLGASCTDTVRVEGGRPKSHPFHPSTCR